MDTTIIQQLEDIKKALANVVTKNDAKNFVTKDDLKNFATKDDLKNFATKDDLQKELAKYATKDDLQKELAKYATKDDLQKLKGELVKEIRDSEAFIVALVDKNMAEKSEIKQLERRVAIIERKLAH